MPFHIEVRRGAFQRARAFNLDQDRMRRGVLEPWARGLRLTLGEREWDPRDCALRIIEGPELSSAELGLGQGWNRAERTGRDATRGLLDELAGASNAVTPAAAAVAPPGIAVLAESLAGGRELSARLAEHGARAVEWASVRERLLSDGPRAAPGGVVLVLEPAPPSGAWLFDAGLAIGALGSRAVVARRGGAPVPEELRGVAVVDMGADPAAAAAELLGRLHAGGGAAVSEAR